MATYYVRKTGSDAAGGTSPATAWATITRALNSSGIAAGDTVYVGAGTYRDVNVTPGRASYASEAWIIADVDGSQTGDAGEVIWSAYATNDKTAPAATTCNLITGGKSNLTFEDFYLMGGNRSGAGCVLATTVSPNIKFRRCVLVVALASDGAINATGAAGAALGWVFESCIFFSGQALFVSAPTHTADYDLNIQFANCLFFGAATNTLTLTPSGALVGKPGGIDVLGTTFIGKSAALTTSTNSSTSIPCTIYNSFLHTSAAALNAQASGQIVEDYNIIWAATPRTNVSVGTNSQSGNPMPYAPLMELGQSWLHGRQPRPFYSPMLTSPMLGFGAHASAPATDILGLPRPSGPGRTWAVATKGVGAFERGNTAERETTTVRTGANALKLKGPATQDFQVPVSAASTTVSVYGRYDATYAGTKPQLKLLQGTDVGVADATATMTAAADTWEQISLNFTPTAAGIVNIRLQSNSTAGGGSAFFDDLAVA